MLLSLFQTFSDSVSGLFGDSATALYTAEHYSVLPGEPLALETPQGVNLIRGFGLTYTTCEIYNLSEPLSNPYRLMLDHVDGLAPGDDVLVAQNLYGGAALNTFQVFCRVADVDERGIFLVDPLPPHIIRHHLGLVVLKRGEAQRADYIGKLRIDGSQGPAPEIHFQASGPHFRSDFRARLSKTEPWIDVVVTTEFVRPCRLFNLSLALESSLPLSELYLKNRTVRKVRRAQPRQDVWLAKEGCRAGSDAASWLLLHNPSLASIEIITGGKGFEWKSVAQGHLWQKPKVVLNLEHYHAQRFRRHLAVRGRNFSVFDDRSAPEYLKGDRREHRFRIFAGADLPSPPRLMTAPGGFRAVHVWTEHSDKTTIETNRAAYYGHETRARAEEATGGFVKFGHVVTKGIFHDNPRSYPNAVQEGGRRKVVGPMLGYRGDPAFREMLDELSARGHEICVHSPAPDNTSAEEARDALSEIAGRYRSPTWIDHDLQGVNCCFGFDGTVDGKSHYMIPAWRKHGIRYFWSWGSEDFAPKKPGLIDLLHNSNGDHTTTPLYWRSPTVPADLITWAANECPLKYFTEEAVDALIAERGVSIHHHYYPFLVCEQHDFGFIRKDADGHYVATEHFNEVLAMMAARRDAGELYITTIGEIMDYWLALERVRFDLFPPDRFSLENTGDRAIDGFAFVVRAERVETHADCRTRALDGGDLLVWLNLPAGGKAEFRSIGA